MTVAKQFHGSRVRGKPKSIVNHLPANWMLIFLYVFYVFLTLIIFLVIWGNSFATCQWPMIGTVNAWGAEVSSGLSWWFLACCLPIWCNLELRIRVAEASPSQKNILHYSDMGRSFFFPQVELNRGFLTCSYCWIRRFFFLMGWHRPPAMIDIDSRLAHWASSRHLSDGPKELCSYVQDE